MITYVKRNELDAKKYDDCITNAVNSRVYAYSWCLDIICDNWDALVKGDYQIVMPLPRRKKYGINYIYLPPWIQQLGVFSNDFIEELTIYEFINSIPRKFILVDIYFNSGNQLSGNYVKIRSNYVLSLDRTHNSIYDNYRKDRKKSLKKAGKSELYFDDQDSIAELVQLYKEVFPALDIKDKSFDVLFKLIEFCIDKKYGFQRNIYMSDQVVARGFFLHYNYRIYYLFGASNKDGKRVGATTFMIDSVIKEFAKTRTVFDFEGSSVTSIENFYKSFGPEKEEYYWYKRKSIW